MHHDPLRSCRPGGRARASSSSRACCSAPASPPSSRSDPCARLRRRQRHPTTNRELPHLVGRLLAYLAFAVVVGGVLLGLTVIVASGLGKELTFDGGVPTIVDK